LKKKEVRMRSVLWGIVVAGSTLTGWLALGAGCGALPAECSERYNCPPGGGGASASSTSTTTTSSGVGGDSGPPPTCVPTMGKDPVADSCGVFVSSSLGVDAAGSGSQAKPYKTLAAAIAAASALKKPVYACAETFTETLTVAEGVALFGGLDCKKSWGYTGDVKSTLTADADAVPLTLSAAAKSVSLFDFTVQAADAVISGGSSIAVIADQVTAAFTRCDLIAGNGVAGLAGMMSTDSVGPTIDTTDLDIRGNNGAMACADAVQSPGGISKDNTFCSNANGGPLGGDGGTGGLTKGGDGAASGVNPQTAIGGTGQLAVNATLDCATGAGHIGTLGASGTDGAGAAGVKALGTIGTSGYGGVAGEDGMPGQPGQGGGGGGGAKGKSMCAGASGGGGGAGGCGGHGGTGGKAGGASIGLVSLGATLTFDSVTVALGKGGAGGDGGDGQPGGVGGIGGFGGAANGVGTVAACQGGFGGGGGLGGKGGGGRGGHAIGIAASGAAPATKGVKFSPMGAVGLGGKGGTSQNGDPGVLKDVQMFP
jgi:hypothetical protein